MSYTGGVYRVNIGDLQRDLRLFRVAPGVVIAIFNMLGDTEVVQYAADALKAQLPADAEALVVPEVKAVPLGHALSARSGLPYVVVRKVRKPYMGDCLQTEVLSITTGAPQTLFIDEKDIPRVRGKRVVLLDDVISTGSTLRGLRQLMAAAGAEIAAEMAVFTEGNHDDWPDAIALGHLPVFGE